MSMKRYDSYKDTGISWIGEIPSHWKVNRMRYVISYAKGKNPKELYFDSEEGMLPYLSMDYLRETFDFTQYSYTEEFSIICKNGDIVLLWDGANAGEFIKSKDGILCSTCALIKPKKISSQYFWYLSKSFQVHLQNMTNGMGVPHVDSEELKNLTAIVPSIEEQKAIAEYLDKKCGSIDGIIATLERRIALLNELKQTIITEAVTRGTNPNVPLKDSGIDWIGRIPEHWDIRRLKFWLKTPLMYGANEAPDNISEADPRYIRITDIDDNGELKNDTYCTLSIDIANPYLIQRGDILFARSGATVGKTYRHIEDMSACFAGYLIKATPDSRISDSEYIYYFTKSMCFANWKDSINVQATIQNIGADKYANLSIPLPPLDEQKAISSLIKDKIKPLDAALTKAKREVELLREYKQSVITEAVTGKIKVI